VVQDDSHTAPQSDKRILDIGTGSGCIALYLAQALPHSTVTGIDINPAAIELAVENKIRNKVSNAVFVQGDVFGQNDWIPDQAREDILEKNSPGGDPGPRKDPLFSLIISNPPYVTEDEYTQIDADVARWEDKSALVADDNGLAFYKKITSLAPQYLATGGMLVFEIGTTQDTKVTALMEATGLTDVTVHQDSFGHNRWVVGKRS
ncbi:MAG: methyltransferase domain-containing protein, partial [Candidatus Dependentiae bacterium]